MKTKIGFSIYLNGKLIREVTFDRPIINIGKLSTSNLRLDDINVSRKHAVIEQRENGQWRVTDLGSTNGTLIAGKRIVQADIHDGDRIVFGTTTLIVHLDEDAVAKVEKREDPKIDKVVSGVAGDVPQVPVAAGKGKKETRAPAAAPGPADEIRGLGEESFYKKRITDQPDEGQALEVALLWGETVLVVESFQRPETIAIGEAAGCRFTVPQEALGGMRYDLVVPRDGQFAVAIGNPNITGDVLTRDGVKTLEELREAHGTHLLLSDATRARLKVGQLTMLLTYGPLPRRTGVARLAEPDIEAWIYIALSAIVHIAFLVVLTQQAGDVLLSERDPRAMRQRAVDVIRVEAEKPPEIEEEEEEEEDPERRAARGEDDGAAEEERELDRVRDVELDLEIPTPTRSEIVDRLNLERQRERESLEALSPEERRERARELAQETALSQALSQSNPLFNQFATDPELQDRQHTFRQLGSVADPSSGAESFAAGSLDPFGGTLGQGGGFQPAGGPGGPPGGPAVAGAFDQRGDRGRTGVPNLDDRPLQPRIIQQAPRLVGELDAETVRQYIRRYLSGIEWCYRDRLQQNRNLTGQLTLSFTIMPNGRVHQPATTNSTLRDAPLEDCIVKRMARWRFPSPKDGGLVQVAYPLILRTR